MLQLNMICTALILNTGLESHQETMRLQKQTKIRVKKLKGGLPLLGMHYLLHNLEH